MAVSEVEKLDIRSHCMPGPKPLLVVTVGLPRSGKSTWARLTGWTVVNPDMVRLAFQNRPFIQETETWIWSIVRVMVKSLVLAGNTPIVIDATHTTMARRREWFPCELWNTMYRIFPVGVEECKTRAYADGREDLIGVIDKMAAEWEPPGTAIPWYPGNTAVWRP